MRSLDRLAVSVVAAVVRAALRFGATTKPFQVVSCACAYAGVAPVSPCRVVPARLSSRGPAIDSSPDCTGPAQPRCGAFAVARYLADAAPDVDQAIHSGGCPPRNAR